MQNLGQAVVVITGASSGIGHASAIAFAKQGSRLVLAARRKKVLDEVASQCREHGVETLVVPTDVTSEDAVKHLAAMANDAFGRIDVWINNAAVSLFSRFEDAPSAVYRRVVETNFFGYVHGARAVLPYFRQQGAGTLINVGSILSEIPIPYASAYVASKYAIRGFGDALRMELSLDEAPNIHICAILPASIDTKLFQNAANYTGRAVRSLKPTYSAGQVARAIVSMAKRPSRQKIVGAVGRMYIAEHALASGIYEKLGAHFIDRGHFKDEPAAPHDGNIFKPSTHTGISGGWREQGIRPAQAYGAAAAALSVLFGVLAGIAWLVGKRVSRR